MTRQLITTSGCWCSYYERGDGQVDYSFWLLEVEVETGTCSEDEMHMRFDALDRSASLPLQ